MLRRYIGELAGVCGGKLFNVDENDYVTSFVNSDKEIVENCCYIALDGERYHGIDFAKVAVDKGAALVLTDVLPNESLPCLIVKDVRRALIEIAAYYRDKERQTVVAVTGSVGKTTVKELCATVLMQNGDVLKTFGNKNNTIGLPLTLLSDNSSKVAIVESGISEKGEMRELSYASKPNVVLITAIGSMHAKTLGTRFDIAHEKLKILEYSKGDRIVIVPFEEKLLRDRLDDAVTISIENDASDYYAKNISFTARESRFDVYKKGKPFIIGATVPIIGEHGVIVALFACALGDILGVPSEKIDCGLKQYNPVGNRQNIIEANGVTVIADCYNFGPESARAATNALSIISGQRKQKKTVLMLGSMLELGDKSEELHFKLGSEIALQGFDILITLGDQAKWIASGAVNNGMSAVFSFSDNERELARRCLIEQAKGESIVLIKGSRKMKMEEFIRDITE